MISKQRDQKLRSVASKRQFDLTVILENVHDPHNIGAIMRTCDAVGINEIFVVYTEDSKNSRQEYVGKKASQGTKKWVDCHFFTELETAIKVIKAKYNILLGTHLNAESKSIHSIDLTQSTALVFGNEKDGISDEMLMHCNGNILIPMVGMVQSLNVSVSVALTIYEAYRQRNTKGLYSKEFDSSDPNMSRIYAEGIKKTYPKIFEKSPEIIEQVIHDRLNSHVD